MKRLFIITKLLFWLAVCQLPGVIAAQTIQANLVWYKSLTMPPFTPPDWVFSVVWSLLYVLLGISAFLVFARPSHDSRRRAFFVLLGQLALNAWWTPLFFGGHDIGGALIVWGLMFIEGIFLLHAFWQAHKTAGQFIALYLIWLLFAGYLNTGAWLLN